MRLWSIHPQYLDAKGLVALWREGLLAQKVLENRTRGYRHHPQLIRFRKSRDPLALIRAYLHAVCDEAEERGYAFDRGKLGRRKPFRSRVPVTSGQIRFEWAHLLDKLRLRDPGRLERNGAVERPVPHPVFRCKPGGIESWEVVKSPS